MSATPATRSSTDRAVSVEVTGLSKSYGEFQALKDVSFTVHRGEIVGFLGPNGAGKTTTMKILTCFMAATSGKASVAGYDVAEQSMEVRKRIGYLPETVPLYPDMLVYDYLMFVARMRQIPAAQIKARLKEAVNVCGLNRFVNRHIRELSKGYRQRVGLAQALIHRPEVLILDEPTSGLDPNQIIEIRDLITEIGREKTIIMSTHILQEVAAVCDRILVIDKGKLVANGTIPQLEARVRTEEHFVTSLATVGADKHDAEATARALSRLSGVVAAEVLETRHKESQFLVTAKRGADIRHEVWTLAQRENLALLGLRREELSLEDIFRSLTGDADQVDKDKRVRLLNRFKDDVSRRGSDDDASNTDPGDTTPEDGDVASDSTEEAEQ
ncbi:MAG: hypothetical protein CMH57_04885 [Myxococcales bacterium]|nr:hypothetical protein [Myxococcales bacterium]